MDQNDPIFPEAGHVNGTSVVGTTESPGVTEADSPTADKASHGADSAGLRPGFLSELASAMRATAERERETIAARVAEDAAVHVEKVRSRAAIETEELRRLAEEDVQHIQEWSTAEMDRIRTEADQRIEDRRASLDEYLRQHDAIIETEIQGVDAAVRDYGTTLDGFFAELAEASDPSAIVARAEALPAPPDLDQVRATARSSAVAMFAEPEAPAETQPEASAEADAGSEAVAEAIVTDDTSSEAIGSAETAADGDSSEVTEFIAPTADVDASNGAGEVEAIAATEPEASVAEAPAAEAPAAEAPAAETTSPADSDGSEGSASTAEPVPVMDPAATANPAWPAPEPAGESKPVTIAPTVDHTSAAVRLLRSVAPWTAPTHAGSDRQQPD